MSSGFEEMRLRDVAIGLQAELTEANYQREKLSRQMLSCATRFKIWAIACEWQR